MARGEEVVERMAESAPCQLFNRLCNDGAGLVFDCARGIDGHAIGGRGSIFGARHVLNGLAR